MNKYFSFIDITGIDSKYVKLFYIDTDGRREWGLKDSHNRVTPMFDRLPLIYPFNDKSAIVVGENDHIRKLFVVRGSNLCNRDFYEEIETIGKLIEFEKIDDENAIIRTDLGDYLFNYATLKPSSSVYNSIDVHDKDLIFTKKVTYADVTNKYYGKLYKNGILGSFLYDDKYDQYMRTPINESSTVLFDVLDTDALVRDIESKVEKSKEFKDNRIKVLSRLSVER